MDFIEFGIILKPQGIRGELKVKFGASGELQPDQLETVYLKENGDYKEYAVEAMRLDQGFAYIKLGGVEDRNEAEKKRNASVYADRRDIPLPEDTHYVSDLIGMKVIDEQGNVLGILKEVIETGSADVYLVKEGQKGFMFPALKRVILKTDIDNKTMTVNAKTLAEVAVHEV